MFRRKWSSLPKDAVFASDLKGLGYFVNDEDEIRSIENPDQYFKFFLNKNTRVNDRQRFEFNAAMGKIVSERLEKEGLQKVNLPLGKPSTDPHVPIFISPDIEKRSHVIVIFGEPTQDLGILAGRVANGPGGLDKGTLVSTVRALKEQVASSTDSATPGIVLANMGQRFWWPEGKRALTIQDSAAIPLPSMVHRGRRYVPSLNDIPGSETPLKHVETIFKEVLSGIVAGNAKITLIAIGESSEVLEKFLDNKKNWEAWGTRLNAIVLLANVYAMDHLTNKDFKDFLAKRARSFLLSDEPRDTPIAPPLGNARLHIEALGMPCYSSGETWCAELILINALDLILAYLQEIASTPNFENPPITILDRPVKEVTEDDWKEIPAAEKPSISTIDPEVIKAQARERRLADYIVTGEGPGPDDEDHSGVEEIYRTDLHGTWDDW